MTKALIVYGTRYGATASISEEVAEILRADYKNFSDFMIKILARLIFAHFSTGVVE